jgi:hypothetical protein
MILVVIHILVLNHSFNACNASLWLKDPQEYLNDAKEGIKDSITHASHSRVCARLYNTYFHISPENGNAEVLAPSENLQPSSKSCCDSCAQHEECNGWQWCPAEVGCFTTDGNNTIRLPYLGCQLMKIEEYTSYARNIGEIRSSRRGIPVIAGSVSHPNVEISGYVSFAGTEAGQAFDFNCVEDLISTNIDRNDEKMENGTYLVSISNSTEFGCAIQGEVEDIATICSRVSLCKGFTYYMRGFEGTKLMNVPFDGAAFGVLKSERLQDTFLDHMGLSPLSVTYLQNGILPNI